MEDQAIYKDEHLTETAKLIDQLLEERGCQLVCAGQFMGNQLITKIVVERKKENNGD